MHLFLVIIQQGKCLFYFKEWRGISSNPFRIPIGDECADVWSPMGEAVAPSSKMLEMASAYKQKYLHNFDYIAVMVRLEKAVETHPLPHLTTFLDKVLNASKHLQLTTRIGTIFVSMDIGRFGSSTLTAKLAPIGFSFFETVTENKTSISIWESSFETVAKTADPAIIARLQSTIVAKSTCAVIAGGGTFQLHTLLMYRASHKGKRSCLEEIY